MTRIGGGGKAQCVESYQNRGRLLKAKLAIKLIRQFYCHKMRWWDHPMTMKTFNGVYIRHKSQIKTFLWQPFAAIGQIKWWSRLLHGVRQTIFSEQASKQEEKNWEKFGKVMQAVEWMQGAHQFIYLGKIENFVKIVLLMKLPEAVLKLNKSYRNCNCCRLPQAWHPQPIARIIEEGNEVLSLTLLLDICK